MLTGLVYLALETLSRLFNQSDDHGARRYRISPVDGSKIALPTPEQLAFQDREIGMIIHFNIATYLDNSYDGCNNFRHLVPDIGLFDAKSLSIDNWMESIKAAGGKHATLVAKHNCGFTTWPTKVRFPLLGGPESEYVYTIQNSPMAGHDIARMFTESAKRHNIGHGFYYSLNFNNYLNVYEFHVNASSVGPEQLSVSQETYAEVVYAQLEEIWSSYGDLVELWFDGGYEEDQKAKVQDLMDRLQPDAVVFNGCGLDGTCITKHPIRWIGTEEGHAPEDNWSTGLTNDGGDPSSEFFAPAECDTATYTDGRWFYGEDPTRTMSQLVDVYHRTVGRNCFLTLGMSPNREGLVPPEHVAAYRMLGDFVSACYDNPVPSHNAKRDSDGMIYEFEEPALVDRVVLMEDQTDGQVIRSYGVYGRRDVGSEWERLSGGKSVGHKKIDLFEDRVTVRQILVNSTSVDVPKWRKISFHMCERV